jgi:hypothetical protein
LDENRLPSAGRVGQTGRLSGNAPHEAAPKERWFQERRWVGRAGEAKRFTNSILRSEGREPMSIVTILIIIILVLLALYLVRRVV